jgi:uncharacterized protein (DUF4415 family)
MSQTNWEKVKQNIDSGAPIPYDGLEDGPYDPNDDDAVDAFFYEATKIGPQERAKGVASIRLDISDSVLEYFYKQDAEHFREHINEALKQYVEEQTEKAAKPELAKAS